MTDASSTTDVTRLHRAQLRRRQTDRFWELLNAVVPTNRFWMAKWQAAGVDPEKLTRGEFRVPDDLVKLPLTTKQELVADQESHPPYGANLTFPVESYSRLHETSGTTGKPLRWLDTPESWQSLLDCWRQIFEIVGLRADDRLCFPFSFGPFLGFWAAFEGASRLGRLCLPGGGLSSEARLQMIADHQATIVCCTPTYALRLAEVATEQGQSLATGSVRALIVAGESGGSVPSIREKIEQAWGARVFDHWGMTEVGPLAIECVENPGGLHVLETECIAEVIDTATGQPFAVPPSGGVLANSEPPIRGELVITTLGRVGSPVIRYRTGDLVEVDSQPCSCGRQLLRLKRGILARVDDMLTIRGNNVFPTAIEAILREFSEVIEFRLSTVTRQAMTELQIEIETTIGIPNTNEEIDQWDELMIRIQNAIHNRLHFRPEILLAEPRSLPRFELKGRRLRRGD